MHLDVCFHFHAYQPGDVVLRRRGDPRDTPRFEERVSPVALRMGEEVVRGENWTDAMLRFYGVVWRLFEEVGGERRREAAGGRGRTGRTAPFCSVDVEPATLQLLAERHPGSFSAFRRLVEEEVVAPVATAPFHILLPHVPGRERRILAGLGLRLHELLFPTTRGAPVGFWLPEGLYSREAGLTVVEAAARQYADPAEGGVAGPVVGSPGAGARRCLYFVLDRSQLEGIPFPQAALSANFVVLDGERVLVFGRDRALSDRWAFRQGTARELALEILATCSDAVKEERGIQYSLTLASDLESLAAAADQGERFRELRRELAGMGVDMVPHPVFLSRKLSGEYASWEGEAEAEEFRVVVRDFSSWSDYTDQGVDYSSDTRWTGLRRWDGLVVSRVHRGRRVSQIWKQGLSKVQERVTRIVARGVEEALAACVSPGAGLGPGEEEEFLLAYSSVVFTPLLLAAGARSPPLDFRGIVDRHFPGCRRDEEAALAARAYYEALISNRSCPRFWESIDTRVTFQCAAFMAHSLLDLAEACERLGLMERAREAERVFVTNLIDFHEVYRYYNLGSLFGYLGWEVSEEAWHMAVQSEVPERSGYDVVKRAALFVALREGTGPAQRALAERPFDPAQVVADTAHIEGELHGEWANPRFCESRGR
ncbi:MAG: hypothetical protein ACUVV6_03590 [Thermoplasmatota archaeon]